MEAKLIFVQALTPLHSGTGQGVGVIDLPVAREKSTGIPFVPGSSLKGVLRDACQIDKEITFKVFGPDTDNADEFSGAISVTDVRLLMLPVRSLRGVYAWVLSPLLLHRLTRDARVAGEQALPEIPSLLLKDSCLLAVENAEICLNQQVVLEDLLLNVAISAELRAWADWLAARIFPQQPDWHTILMQHICLVPDDIMSFLLETGTEVIPRIALEKEKKTVRKGALWYEESLPAETILSGMVVAQAVGKNASTPNIVFDAVKTCIKKPLQVGGNATVGSGICRLNMI